MKMLSILIICFLMAGCTEVAEKVIKTPVSTVEPTAHVEEIGLNASLKPYALNEEGKKVFKLLTNNDTQLYTLDIKEGIAKRINISSYRLIDGGWHKEDFIIKEIQQDCNNIGLNIHEVKESIYDESDTFEINVMDFDDSGNKTLITKYIEYDDINNEMAVTKRFINEDITLEDNREYIIYQLIGSYGNSIQTTSYLSYDMLDEELKNGELSADAVMVITLKIE